ncbi:hypothetical protein [Cytobacillus depressus]|nr:hypothetical protein [Cytobacillus depressus]
MIQIKNKEESINMLKEANEKHIETIEQIEAFIKKNEDEVNKILPLF